MAGEARPFSIIDCLAVSYRIGGRGQWRVEESELDGYIARMYEQTRRFVAEHPFGATDTDESDRITAFVEKRDPVYRGR